MDSPTARSLVDPNRYSFLFVVREVCLTDGCRKPSGVIGDFPNKGIVVFTGFVGRSACKVIIEISGPQRSKLVDLVQNGADHDSAEPDC